MSESYRLSPLGSLGTGFSASVEGGYPFLLNYQWVIEPQIQGIYQTVNLNSGKDIGGTIRFNDGEAVTSRLGVRFVHKQAFNEGEKVLTTWFRPNVWYQFKGTPNAAFSSAYGFIPFQSQLEGATLELNLGTTLDLPNNFALYANGSYGVGLNIHMTSYDGRIGFKVKL